MTMTSEHGLNMVKMSELAVAHKLLSPKVKLSFGRIYWINGKKTCQFTSK